MMEIIVKKEVEVARIVINADLKTVIFFSQKFPRFGTKKQFFIINLSIQCVFILL